MPRNSQGLYTLPLPPVEPNTLIESAWANTTLDDIAAAMTGSLPRNGAAPMTGPLTLSANPITGAKQATTKEYVDQFIAYATGIPVGSISAYAGALVPPGWLRCDGAEVSRTTYATLFATIGTVYGTPSSAQVFKLPDLRNEFVRGIGGTRTLGSKEAASFAEHSHPVPQFIHTHTVQIPQTPHQHLITGLTSGTAGDGTIDFSNGLAFAATGVASVVSPSANGIQAQASSAFHSQVALAPHTHTVDGATMTNLANIPTGAFDTGGQTAGFENTNPVGGAETVPQNIALNYYIKAVDDSSAGLDIGNGQQFLGFFDALSKDLPQVVYPTVTYVSGDTYQISVGGTLFLFDPATLTGNTTTTVPGDFIVWVEGANATPEGWYKTASNPNVITAAEVTFQSTGTIGANNVQLAIEEVDTEARAGIQQLEDLKVNRAGDIMTGPLEGPQAQFSTVKVLSGFIGPGGPGSYYFTSDASGNLLLSRDGGPASVMSIDAVTNNTTFIGDVTAFSDERLKENWDHLPDEFVMRLSRVIHGTFDRKDTGQRQAGVSAQSLQCLLPEVVREGEGGMLSVAYGNAALVACIALAKEIEVLKRKVEQLGGLL